MRGTRHKITFEDPEHQEVVVKASMGIGNRELRRISGLSDCQVNFMLHKAKTGLGMEHGFRVDWRNGNHPMFGKIYRHFAGVMKLHLKRKLVPQYAHPTPEVRK